MASRTQPRRTSIYEQVSQVIDELARSGRAWVRYTEIAMKLGKSPGYVGPVIRQVAESRGLVYYNGILYIKPPQPQQQPSEG